MLKSAFDYAFFAFNIILKKKSSLLIPITIVISSFIVGLIFKFIITDKYHDLASFLYTFLIIVVSVIYGSIKALNLFKDLQAEGLEIITLSKPISRKSLILGKLICLAFFGLIWSASLLVSGFLYLYATNNFVEILLKSLLLFIVSLIVYFLISLFVSLLSYKLSQKIAITIPLIVFIPLSLTGMVLASNVRSNLDQASFFINQKYQYHHAGNQLNAEAYFLNNNKDELLLMPNGFENKEFNEQQLKYLNDLVKHTNQNLSSWQVYSWISIPYQLINIFNFKNKNLFNSVNNHTSNLSNYLYYKNLDDISYNYKLIDNLKQTKYLTKSFDANFQTKIFASYIVPGLLKAHSIFSDQTQTTNYDVIYARVGVDKVESDFIDDQANFSNNDSSFVGRIKWDKVFQALQDQKFNQIAKKFVNQLTCQLSNNKKSLKQLNSWLLQKISEYLANPNSEINTYQNFNLDLFDPNSIKQAKLGSIYELDIYKAVLLMNYIYFNNQDSLIYQAMIKNPNDENTYANYQISLKIKNQDFLIGGFKAFNKTVLEKEKKPVIRYHLEKSDDNYLFSSAPNLYAITRNQQIVNKYIIFALWIILIATEFVLVFKLYQKKEYI
ncbi:ABC transporter permease [Mycoplasma putrefaciens]|uniref:ABC transporter, permease protein n=1 Tax=Mycoplasma putrefaciens Mput9231 TaxID=1292033 RepID=M9WGY2_9MOLU|nr:ABC transporter permease [Mycoplasma putrefaciens]AGJ90654.1 Hypothetical protein, predicted transmembrane protein [Mycoplasma putrefaciens Mput9231]